MSDGLKDREIETIAFAPLWIYTAVTNASGPADPSQFRLLQELLEVGDRAVERSDAGRAALISLRANLESKFAAFLELGDEPKKGLERTRNVLKRLPEDERDAIKRWLVEIAIRIAEASRTLGEPAIDDPEVHAIRDVAKWLDAPTPDLGPR